MTIHPSLTAIESRPTIVVSSVLLDVSKTMCITNRGDGAGGGVHPDRLVVGVNGFAGISFAWMGLRRGDRAAGGESSTLSRLTTRTGCMDGGGKRHPAASHSGGNRHECHAAICHLPAWLAQTLEKPFSGTTSMPRPPNSPLVSTCIARNCSALRDLGVRIEAGQHAIDRILHQFLVRHWIDVLAAHPLEHVAKQSE